MGSSTMLASLELVRRSSSSRFRSKRPRLFGEIPGPDGAGSTGVDAVGNRSARGVPDWILRVACEVMTARPTSSARRIAPVLVVPSITPDDGGHLLSRAADDVRPCEETPARSCAAGAHGPGQGTIAEQSQQPIGERLLDVVDRDSETGFAVGDDFGNRPRLRANTGQAKVHGFDKGNAERFEASRQHEYVGGLVRRRAPRRRPAGSCRVYPGT